MSIQACAEKLRDGDPDRFLATMAAPPAMRPPLFALYAFNLEVARAPWVSSEVLIAEMRLQWWRDVLDDIAKGAPPRRHEVAEPLAEVLTAQSAERLDRLVAARRQDLEAAPFSETEDLFRFLDDSAGTLMAVAGEITGQGASATALADIGWASGLAGWLRAVPELQARGKSPLPSDTPDTITALAREGLSRLSRGHASLNGTAKPVALAAWRARHFLDQAMAEPTRVLEGRLGQSEFRRRASLIWQSFRAG